MAKLSFQRLKADKSVDSRFALFEAQFSPTELSFTKAAQFADVAIPGLDQPVIQFVRGDAQTLALELFFDSTESGTGAKATSVTADVARFQKLVTVDGELHAPPLVRLTWGDDFPGNALGDGAALAKAFDAVVVSCTRRFSLFNPDGKPLRANVTLSLKEYVTLSEQVAKINYRSADHTRVHAVREGETLPLIAYEAYADPAKWRVIAAHNRLSDARTLQVGALLELPPIEAGR